MDGVTSTTAATEAADSDEEQFYMSRYTYTEDENDEDDMYWPDVPLPSVEEPFPGLEPESGEAHADPRWSSSPPLPPSIGPSQQPMTGRLDGARNLRPALGQATVVGSSGPLLEKMQEAAQESTRRASAREMHALALAAGNRGRGGRPRAATGPPAFP